MLFREFVVLAVLEHSNEESVGGKEGCGIMHNLHRKVSRDDLYWLCLKTSKTFFFTLLLYFYFSALCIATILVRRSQL